MKLTDDIEIFHDGYWFQGKYNDTGFSISLNQQCSKEDAEQLLKELTQNQKLRELVEKRIESNKTRPFLSCSVPSTVHGDNAVKREIETRILKFLLKESKK